jgi:hypothetical protein
MVRHKNDNLSANEGFATFSTSKLIICFINGLTSKMKSEPIAYFPNENEHVYGNFGP